MASVYKYGRRRKWLALALLLVGLALLTQSNLPFVRPGGTKNSWAGQAGQAIIRQQPGFYSVAYFVDGDTIAVNMNGQIEKVRFIGVDTPETHKPNTPVQCYGPAAAAFTKNTIGNNPVRLVADPLSTDRDRYNRLLRYVFLPDGTDLNEKLIQNGYGFYYPYFPFTKSAEFAAAEASAQSPRLGLWRNCQPTPTDGGGWVSNNAG